MKSEASTSEEIQARFPDKRMVKGTMGGAVFVDEQDGKF
jgi:hypothetical protein